MRRVCAAAEPDALPLPEALAEGLTEAEADPDALAEAETEAEALAAEPSHSAEPLAAASTSASVWHE